MITYTAFATESILNDTATVYAPSTTGVLQYGIKCFNQGFIDYMLFDTLEDAKEYLEFLATMA